MNSKGEIIMKKLKKCLSLCLVILTIILSVVSVGATISKKSDPSMDYSGSTSLLYSGGKYIMANEKGIFVAKTPTSKWKKITSKYRGNGGQLISDGKTIYFTTTTSGGNSGQTSYTEKYIIYSIKTTGKSLRKIKSGSGPADLIACYGNNLYYGGSIDGFRSNIIKLNLKNKKVRCVSGKYSAGLYQYLNGRIYFSPIPAEVSSEKSRNTYCLNLKTQKIKKVISHSIAMNMSKSTNSIAILSNKYGSSGGTTNNYIYTINSKHKITKSKKLPNNVEMRMVSKDNKYAYYLKSVPSTASLEYYRFNLKTGKKEKIKGTSKKQYYNIIGDCKSSDIYFNINTYSNNSMNLKVYKLSGTKLIRQKISGKTSKTLNSSTNYWISGKYLITNCKGKIKVYKLS